VRTLFVFATQTEADILKNIQGIHPVSERCYIKNSCEIVVLVTGVGGISTSWSMKEWLYSNRRPDLAINAGIAGSFNDDIKIGDVVMPLADCFADMGIENGKEHLSIFEAGLMKADQFPFRKGFIWSENEYVNKAVKFLRSAKAITVNTSSGSESTIKRLKSKYNPDIETMEGATFFYICAMEKIPFLAVRSVSNIVETRNNKGWDIPMALENLKGVISEILLMLE
jgi:futalosine hydrolase